MARNEPACRGRAEFPDAPEPFLHSGARKTEKHSLPVHTSSHRRALLQEIPPNWRRKIGAPSSAGFETTPRRMRITCLVRCSAVRSAALRGRVAKWRGGAAYESRKYIEHAYEAGLKIRWAQASDSCRWRGRRQEPSNRSQRMNGASDGGQCEQGHNRRQSGRDPDSRTEMRSDINLRWRTSDNCATSQSGERRSARMIQW